MFASLGQIFFSFLTTPIERMVSSAMVTVVEDFALKGRQTLMIVVGSFILSLLFSAGLILALFEGASQYDKNGSLYFSGLLTISLGLTVVALAGLASLFWPRNRVGAVKNEAPQTAAVSSSPLEELLSRVISESVHHFRNRHDTSSRPQNYSRA